MSIFVCSEFTRVSTEQFHVITTFSAHVDSTTGRWLKTEAVFSESFMRKDNKQGETVSSERFYCEYF